MVDDPTQNWKVPLRMPCHTLAEKGAILWSIAKSAALPQARIRTGP